LLRAVLYEVSAYDPLTITSASGILVIVSGLACYLPARTATQLDPLIVLRSD
jgi:putative ABC transport system permease protein